jgi:two-component system CheB/CheR fusion protein
MADGLLMKPYFLAGRATRISGNGALAMSRGGLRAAAWTTRRIAAAAKFLNPFSWRIAGRGRLERKILETSSAEQRRIGQDLHDGVGQLLTGVALMSRALERELTPKLPDRAADAAQIAEIAEEGMARTRSMARVLSPLDLDADGLTSALDELASDCEKVFAVTCTFEHDESVLVDDESVATHVYRIAQEAVTNAARHGGAKRVEIGLGSEGRSASLTVQDDGAGFAAEGASTGKANGMGLRIMECRAKAIGGTLAIRSLPEGGTVVTCTFPGKGKRK